MKDREKWEDVVPDSMEMDNSKSLYINDELKTDDTRGEMSTVSKKMIELNNPECKDDISVCNTSVSESERKKKERTNESDGSGNETVKENEGD